MLMYPDHLWNWLHFGHGLLIFLMLAGFWHSETGQICIFQIFSWECMEGMGYIMSCWTILTTFRSDFDFGHGLLIFLILVMSALWFRANLTGPLWQKCAAAIRSLDLLVHVYLLYRKKWKRRILAYESYPLIELGYSWLLCSQTFLVLFCSWNRIVCISFHLVSSWYPYANVPTLKLWVDISQEYITDYHYNTNNEKTVSAYSTGVEETYITGKSYLTGPSLLTPINSSDS